MGELPDELPGALKAHRVVVLTRDGCHLCEDALALVGEEVPRDAWASVDVDAHPALRQRYTDHVPVVFLDGDLFAYWTLERGRLVNALAGQAWSAPPAI